MTDRCRPMLFDENGQLKELSPTAMFTSYWYDIQRRFAILVKRLPVLGLLVSNRKSQHNISTAPERLIALTGRATQISYHEPKRRADRVVIIFGHATILRD